MTGAKARSAAKAEVEGTGPVYTIGTGTTFHLPPRLVYGIARLAETDYDRCLQRLLGDEQFEVFCDEASVPEAVQLLRTIGELYGTDAGESEASTESSGNTSERSRPTSSPTTD